MEKVTFGLGGGAGAQGGGLVDPQQRYIQGLLAQAQGHGARGADQYGHGPGKKKPNPLVQLAVLGLGGFIAWKKGLHTKVLEYLRKGDFLKKLKLDGLVERVSSFFKRGAQAATQEAPKLLPKP